MKSRSLFILFILLLTACTAPQPSTAALPTPLPTQTTLSSQMALPSRTAIPSSTQVTPSTQTATPSPTQTIPPSPAPTQDPASLYQSAWGIDYAHPEKYLAQGDQTRLSDPSVADDLRLEQKASRQNQLYMLGRIYMWIKGEFETWSARGATIGKVTTDNLFASHRLGGCHDWGLVYVSLARELGYPTVVVDTLGLVWAKQFQSGERGPYTGHVFVEVYVDGKWVLVDSTNNWYVETGYDPSNPILPLKSGKPDSVNGIYGFYVMRKGLDTWNYGIKDDEALHTLMETTARQLNFETLVYPQYEFQRFH